VRLGVSLRLRRMTLRLEWQFRILINLTSPSQYPVIPCTLTQDTVLAPR
jgi:hypothetical protein